MFTNPPWKLNIDLCHPLLQNHLVTKSVFLNNMLLLFMRTTQVQFKLLQILTLHPEAFDDKLIPLPHVTIDLQVADIFTKALPQVKYQFFVKKKK